MTVLKLAELEWQARWFSGELGRDWVSSEQEAVRVVQFGVWNRGPGPDFLEAAVCVGGEVRRGAIELDMTPEDWERHGHGTNTDYAEVVLHVVVHGGRGVPGFTRTCEHRRVPRVFLDQGHGKAGQGLGLEGGTEIGTQGGPEGAPVRSRVDGQNRDSAKVGTGLKGLIPDGVGHEKIPIIPPVAPGRCARALGRLGLEELGEWLREAARRRFDRKSRAFARGAEAHGFSEALFQAVATGLGYRGNELPFRWMAQRLPVVELERAGEWREGWLFGMAGWISQPTLDGWPLEARGYARMLWEGWWRHRGESQREPLAHSLWRLGRQRPSNHPQRRLGALSGLVPHWRRVTRLCRVRDWEGLRRMLLDLRHPFWSWHWTLASERMKRPMRLLGSDRVEDLLWNAFYPAAGDTSSLQLPLRGEALSRGVPKGASVVASRPRETFWRREGEGDEKEGTIEPGFVKGFDGRCRVAAGRLLMGFSEEQRRRWLRQSWFRQGLMEWDEEVCRRDASDCMQCRFPEFLEAQKQSFAIEDG